MAPDQAGRLLPEQLEQYALAVAQFVDLARNIGAEPVLVTQARLPVPGSPESGRERIHYEYVGLDHETLVRAFEETGRILARGAQEKDALLVDASRPLSGRSSLFADHIHLAADGSLALARLVADALAPAVIRYRGAEVSRADAAQLAVRERGSP